MPPKNKLTWDFVAPLRTHHLSGGQALLMGNNRLCMIVGPGGLQQIFSLHRKASMIGLVASQCGLRVLGRTHFRHAEEMKDPVTSNFVTAALTDDNRCLAHTQGLHWSGVATALHQDGSGPEALLASRVHAQIDLCIRRLERLSIAYRTALSIVGSELQEVADGEITSNKYAKHIGSEYRSFLNELYSLRDAINAAAYRLRYGGTDGFSTRALKPIVLAARSGVGRLIADSMFGADGDLLIDRMSLHRGVAQHCLGKNNPLLADVYQLRRSLGPLGLPYLVFPLYDDVEQMRAIEKGSSKGILQPPTRAEAERFLQKQDHLDALEFLFDCFVRLLRIAKILADEIGLESRLVTITDDDIIEANFTDQAGKVTRIRRDATTGKLVEY